MDRPVHLRNYRDGYPLCWDIYREGAFSGSYKITEINCKDCIQIINDG